MSEHLKLMALDADDLAVVSAHTQDAVLKVGDIDYVLGSGIVVLPMSRFAWEAPLVRRWPTKKFERRLAALHFARVTALRSAGIDRDNKQQVLSLLSITFENHDDDDPAGTITLTFAGNAAVQLDVECVEAQLSDLGAAWSTSAKPRHSG